MLVAVLASDGSLLGVTLLKNWVTEILITDVAEGELADGGQARRSRHGNR